MAYKTLKKGSSGEAVEHMQRMLIALGYDCGSGVDGVFGPATLGAVRAFQHDKGLTVDGIAGQKTLTALYTIDHEVVGRTVAKCIKDVQKLDSFQTLEVLLGG